MHRRRDGRGELLNRRRHIRQFGRVTCAEGDLVLAVEAMVAKLLDPPLEGRRDQLAAYLQTMQINTTIESDRR